MYKKLKIEDVIPWDKNPRQHNEAPKYILDSLREHGQVSPILINEIGYPFEQHVICAGHGRLKALQEFGAKEIDVYIHKFRDEKQFADYAIRDNQTATFSSWDDKLLAELAGDFDLAMEEMGFEDFETAEQNDGGTDEDDVPDAPEEPTAKLGQIWKLGDHRLMCGDSTDRNQIKKLMGKEEADLWITDPPYNVAYEGKTSDALKIENDDMSNDDFRKFLVDCYGAADEVMKKGASFYIWHADSEGYNFRGAAFDVGWPVRQCLIWAKSTMVMGRQDYQWKHEPCLYGWKPKASHNWYSDRKQTTLLEFDKPSRNGDHPTMKPVELFEYQILNSTKKEDIVLDSFGGSGTTMIACEKNKRSSRLMEFDPRYADVIIKRWEDFTGKKAELIDG